MTSQDRFLTELRGGLQRCQLDQASVLIGVSGGADSVALFHGLLALRDEFALVLRVAHLNHQLRGNASDADADWVERLCRSHEIPVRIGSIELNLPSTSESAGIEEAARDARHRFLDQVAVIADCSVIATAHTSDDQVETVLHHLFRGTGLSGLRGIPICRTTSAGRRLMRPMLGIRRELVLDYLMEIGQEYRTDVSNSDVAMTRNWLRHNLLPDLRGRFGPRVDLSLTRLVEQAAEIELALTILARRLLDQSLLDAQPDTVRLNARLLTDQPVHLVRELFRELWQRQHWPLQAMGFGEWNRVAEVALVGGDANLPGSIRARQKPAGLLILEKTNRQTAVRS